MYDAMTFPPMPAFTCPAWCDEDHSSNWRDTVENLSRPYRIPNADGTVFHGEGSTPERIAHIWEPLHLRTVGVVDLGGNEEARVDLQRGSGDETCVFVAAEGAMTAQQARTFAASLLEAAALLEVVGQ